MKNLLTIIAAGLLLGTASMAAEHTGIDNNSAYLDLRPNGTTRHLYISARAGLMVRLRHHEFRQPGLYITRQGNSVVKSVVK